MFPAFRPQIKVKQQHTVDLDSPLGRSPQSLSEKGHPKRRKHIARLNQSDLQALFRRLDVNGNGDLSFSEFKLIVKKLNLTSPSVIDSLAEVFNMANTDVSGSSGGALNLKEFVAAYDILYNKLVNDNEQDHKVGIQNDPEANIVRATRYGYFGSDENGDKKYIFECYTGTLADITTKFIYDLPNIDDDAVENFTSSAVDISKIEYRTEELSNYNIETINRLILEDGARNFETGARVMWWVDYCSRSLKHSELSQISKAIGIPNNIRDSLELPSETRFSFGTGEVICEGVGKLSPAGYVGKTAMLSIFPQSFYLKNKPIVDRDPAWMRAIPYGIGEYISSRFAMFYDLHKVPCTERMKVVSQVNTDITALLDKPISSFVDNKVETPKRSTKGKPIKDSAHQTLLPIPPVIEHQGATFSLSYSDMKKRVPEIYNEMFSLHIQNQGYGPMALFTIRKLDGCLPDGPGPDQQWGIEQNSRAGIIGSTMNGLWLKLLEVTANEGVVNIAADLDDSTFSLALTIVVLLHNTSMLTSMSLEHWLDSVSREIEDIAVTKHSKHIEKAEEMLCELRDYVEKFNGIFEPLIECYLSEASGETVGGKEAIAAAFNDYTHVFDMDADNTMRKSGERRLESPLRGALKNVSRLDGNDVMLETMTLRSVFPFSPVNWEKASHAVKYKILSAFAVNDTVRRIPELIYGVEKLEVQGTLYWKQRIECLAERITSMHARYTLCLDEKRNLWGFTLGIVSIATFPFSVMTGYFGMNFENMAYPGAVLTDGFTPSFPGEKFLWVTTVIVYVAMILLSLHYFVIHSAT